MKYLYNEPYGIMMYPENWFDVVRIWITHLIHPSFKRTWKDNPYWYKIPVHTIERKLETTAYPNLASC